MWWGMGGAGVGCVLLELDPAPVPSLWWGALSSSGPSSGEGD